MRRGTTPVIVLNTGMDLSQVAKLYVTFAQEGNTIIEKDETECDIDEGKIIITLTQEDTLLFTHSNDRRRCNNVAIQVRVRFENGTAMASNIVTTNVKEILKDGEI